MSAAIRLNLHFNHVHWTAKPGKPEGRFLADLSNAKSGQVLNNDSAKSAIEARYGRCYLPTIRDIVTTIYDVANTCGGLSFVSLWKDDIVSAFNQWNFSPTSACLLAFRLSVDVCLIQYTGNFGWQGSPSVWGVFNRAFDRAVSSVIRGKVSIYVDDVIAASPTVCAVLDQAAAQDVIRGALGHDAINNDKSTTPCRCLDAIGWTIDLENERVYPNEKGCSKLAAVFFSVDLSQPLSHNLLQRMGSLAARYSQAVIGTRPFVNAFFEALKHPGSHHATPQIRLAILVWRAVAITLLTAPLSLAVPLSFFLSIRITPELVGTTDAGPEGIGVVIRDTTGRLVAFCSYRLPFVALESKYQNVREFLGLLLGCFLAAQFSSQTSLRITWINDNTSALSWARKDISRSSAAQAAFLAWTWCCVQAKVVLVDAQWIPGLSMGDVDSLSRFRPVVALDPAFDVSHKLPLELLDSLFRLTDPTVNPEHPRPWDSIVPIIISLVHRCLTQWL